MATLAANKWDITKDTYVVVLEYVDDYDPDDSINIILDSLVRKNIDYVYFAEPDLDNLSTTLAVLNPPKNTFSYLRLWTGGGETNE